MCKFTHCVLLIFIIHLTLVNCIEPLTIGGVTVALISAGYGTYEAIKCKFSECCDDNWIHFNRSGK